MRLTQMRTTNPVSILLFAVFFYIYMKLSSTSIETRMESRDSLYSGILSGLFTIFTLAASYTQLYGSMTSTLFRLIILFLSAAGLALLYYHAILCLLIYSAQVRIDTTLYPVSWLPYASFGACMLFWLPYYLHEYPGVMTPDSINQYAQIIGAYELSNHHSVIQTLLIGFFYHLGLNLTGSEYVGLGLYTLFQMCFMDPNHGTASAQYIAEQKLGTKIAIIWKNDDVYSTGIHDKFVEEAKTKGLEVVSDKTFTDASANDFSVQLNDAKSKGADLVFLPMYYQPASLILTQANAMGYAPKFFGVDGMDGILTMENFDPKLAEGVMLLTPFNADATDEKTVNFVKKYKEQFGETPNQFAADAYDCVYAYKQALENAGATPDMSAEDLCDKMIEQFTSMTFDGLTGEGMTWDSTGAVSKSPKGMVIENGAYAGM